MKKITFYLTSIPIKLLAIIITFVVGGLSAVLIVYRNQVPWFIILFPALLTCLLGFFSVIFLLNRITIDLDKQIIKIQNIKFQNFSLRDIQEIEVDTSFSLDKKKYSFIIFKLKDFKTYKLSGYSSLFNKNSVKKSKNIVGQINNILKRFNEIN